MNRYVLMLAFLLPAVVACKQKKKEPEKKFVSVLSLIKSQVAHVDTSLYPILRIETKDSLHSDTSYIAREEFEAAAKDFLDLPDLADKKIARRFKEETLYDQTLNRVIITYTPLEAAKEEVQKQELLVTPNSVSGDKVTNIIVNRIVSNRDSLLQRNMLWQMDKYFQVTTIRQLPGKPETVTTLKVSWNEEPQQ